MPDKCDPTGGHYHPVRRSRRKVVADLIGSDDPFGKSPRSLMARFSVIIRNESTAILKIGSEKVTLAVGSYTDWIKVNFKVRWGVKISGICKFLLQTSLVRSIRIDYPSRSARLIGIDTWILTLLTVAMATAFLCKPLFKVRF